MKRRVIGILLALVLASAGTIMLVAYVKNAKDDAVKGEDQVNVFVVDKTIAQGSTVAEITSSVSLVEMPKRLMAHDAVLDLNDLDSGLVAGVDFEQGDQLLISRMVDPRSLVRVGVPDGLQEITVSLSPERAAGADLLPGDLVGVVMSFDPFDVAATVVTTVADAIATDPTSSTQPALPTKTPNTSHLTLNTILVTAVQYSKQDSQRVAQIQGTSSDLSAATDTTLAATVAESPDNNLLITMAVTAAEAEQVAFAAEFGHIWLTVQGVDSSAAGSRVVTRDQVYVTVPR